MLRSICSKTKTILPTYPNFSDHVTPNAYIIFSGPIMVGCTNVRENSTINLKRDKALNGLAIEHMEGHVNPEGQGDIRDYVHLLFC